MFAYIFKNTRFTGGLPKLFYEGKLVLAFHVMRLRLVYNNQGEAVNIKENRNRSRALIKYNWCKMRDKGMHLKILFMIVP